MSIINKFMQCLEEQNTLSLTRVIAITGWIAFLVGSFYLLFTGKSWDHYEIFSIMTAGGGAATQISNKLINSKYNSVDGGTDQVKVTITKDNKSITSLNS